MTNDGRWRCQISAMKGLTATRGSRVRERVLSRNGGGTSVLLVKSLLRQRRFASNNFHDNARNVRLFSRDFITLPLYYHSPCHVLTLLRPLYKSMCVFFFFFFFPLLIFRTIDNQTSMIARWYVFVEMMIHSLGNNNEEKLSGLDRFQRVSIKVKQHLRKLDRFRYSAIR